MALAKMSIKPENAQAFDVMFNPNSYSISKTVFWNPATAESHGGAKSDSETADVKTNAPTMQFGGGGARQLSMQLFYDITEPKNGQQDVRTDTDKIVKLTRIMRDRQKAQPPVCVINWGGAQISDFPFTGTVTSLTQHFTLFDESGRPLRATLDVIFTEFLILTDDQLKTDPELTTRTVRRGDTLASIAAEAGLEWRVIALANRIEDPFRVPPGTILTLPKV
jgi:nucleoid-associated protein YgaU